MTEVEPDLDEPEVMLEPDDSGEPMVDVSSVEQVPETVNILKDDTFSPPPFEPLPRPPAEIPGPAASPSAGIGNAVAQIRETLEATGDLKPRAAGNAAETFMVPPASLQEAQLAAEDLDSLDDFDAPDDDSLDLGSDSDSLSIGEGLLDDLDDE
jgi:hypothetical protein